MDLQPTRSEQEPIPGLALRKKTPARILVGRAGGGYRTSTLLELRRDHAAARDAIWDEIDLERDLPGLGLFSVQSAARDKHEYLLRPDLGRVLSPAARHCIAERCPREVPVQLLVGDGLSAAAVRRQVPRLLPLLLDGLRESGEPVGTPFFVRLCRVGVLNEVGELLRPEVVILLIGERPGLATAESLSAYMAFRPQPGDTDARRNLISNIHDRGVPVEQAARRILALARQLRQARQSGVAVKEILPLRAPALDRRPEHG